MTEETDGKIKRATWPQWIAGIGALMLMAQVGFTGAWSSPYISQLTSPKSPISLTMSEVLWVVSLINIGRPIGAILGAVCINYFGSKTAVLLTNVPAALSWSLMLAGTRVEWLYTARLFGGISVGSAYSCYSVYLGEIADSSNRGALVALATSGIPIGNLIMSTMGGYLPLGITAAATLACSLMVFLLFLWLPESPHHLIKKHSHEKAKASILWYQRDADVETEFVSLQAFVNSVNARSFTGLLREMTTPHFRNMIRIILILIMYSQICGINSIAFYMESTLRLAKVNVLPPAQVVIIVMACGIVGSTLSTFLMDRFGRKFLMIASCIGASLSLSLLGVEFHLLNFGFDPNTVQALSVLGMCCFYMSIFVGVLPVAPAMLGEIFPPHLKCIAACIMSIAAGVFAFVSSSTYVPLLEIMTERYLFFFYASIMLTAVPVTMFCVPETKGMTLQEIHDKLSAKSKKRSSKVSVACIETGRKCRE